jgi:hypothetical protein
MTTKLVFSSLSISFVAGIDPVLHSYWLSSECPRPEAVFFNLCGPRNRFQRIDSASLCSLASRYDNLIPIRFLAPIDWSKIPAQV